jgi:hypothetical protein
MDGRELCVRLSRYLDGHRHELRPIRIPSRAEQQRRELGRQREFWKREVRRLENHGRALRIEHEHESLEAGWAGPRKWKRLAPQCSEFVREQLEPVVAQICWAKAQLDRLSQKIEALVQKEQIPAGVGALTVSLIDAEVCDWRRFTQRKAVGSYTGCCPSEHSSGGVQRFGSIRPARQQASASVVSRSGVAAVALAARLARPAEIFNETAPRDEKENCRRPGPTIGHRSVALAHRPGQRCRTGLEITRCCGASSATGRSFSLYQSATSQAKCAAGWDAARRCSWSFWALA